MKTNLNSQQVALIKLGLWVVFITVVIFILNIGNHNKNTETKTEENVFLSYEKMQDEILNSDYLYHFVVNNADTKIIYEGVKKDNIITGFKETSAEILKYQIKDNQVSKITLDNTEIIPDLYSPFLEDYLNTTRLINYLKTLSYNTTKNENTREIKYTLSDGEILVKTNLKHLTSISIQKNDSNYVLEFTNIGNYDNINL